MGKEPGPEKLRTMARGILPSKNRKAARKGKTLLKRSVRRGVRIDVHKEDPETTRRDLLRDANQSSNVAWRRDGDKLNHFLRWCHAITEGMRPEDAVSYVRGLLPRNLIGEHAVVHWKAEVRRRRFTGPSYREQQRREEQSLYDRTRFHLRRVLEREPHRLGELNAAIKAAHPPDEPRRLLLGMHDLDAFVAEIVDWPAELARVWTLIEEVKRGRPATGRPFRALMSSRSCFRN
jgi:hypothetical protein